MEWVTSSLERLLDVENTPGMELHPLKFGDIGVLGGVNELTGTG